MCTSGPRATHEPRSSRLRNDSGACSPCSEIGVGLQVINGAAALTWVDSIGEIQGRSIGDQAQSVQRVQGLIHCLTTKHVFSSRRLACVVLTSKCSFVSARDAQEASARSHAQASQGRAGGSRRGPTTHGGTWARGHAPLELYPRADAVPVSHGEPSRMGFPPIFQTPRLGAIMTLEALRWEGAMNGTLSLIELAGHVGLLLWGTHMVGTGVQRGFGTVLRRWLGRNLGHRFRAFLTGLGVTALLQSSTATGLLATSFTATGVSGLAPALAVMLGANVGTALLTQVLFFNVALLGPPLVLVGVLLFRWAGGGRAKNIGRIGIGLGLMLMALSGLVHTLGPLANAPLLRSVMGALASDPVLAALVAAALTWACHSSIAIVLLVATFAATHVIAPTGALALVLGANIGGALPALVGASTAAARRLPLGNLLVRTVGVLLALPFLPAITHALELVEPSPGRLVVNFHLAFNLALAVLFLAFVSGLAQLLTRWLPDPPAPVDPGRPVYLDVAALDSATVALANAARETLRMADMVETMLRDALEVLRHGDQTRTGAIP